MKMISRSIVLIFVTAVSALAQVQLNASQQVWVEETLAKMSVDEKIGQLLFPVATATFTNQESEAFQEIKQNIQTYHAGGFHLQGGNPVSASLLINRMQQLTKVPLLITADFEGGPGSQVQGATRFPRAMAIGATGNPQYAYDAASVTAKEAKAMGYSVNFYPVVDVNNNPQNPIINIRSFGENPQSVAEFGAAYIKGTQDNGVIATAKHFPGHGDTTVDSHLELPVINFDRARLDLIELPPFQAAIKSGVDAVMTAHIYLPQFEKSPGVPASLSDSVTTGLLRKDLGFQGLIFTDALPMHAITAHFGAEQAVVMAIAAGADVALIPVDVPKAFVALQQAVRKGEITEPRLNESVRRLLAAKVWAGLDVQRAPDLSQVDVLVGSRAAQQKSQEIIERALTLVVDEKNAIPLKLDANEQVLLLNIADADSRESAGSAGSTFRTEFLRRHPKTLFASVPPAISRNESDLIRQLAGISRTVVVSCSIRVASYKGSIGLTDVQVKLLREIARHDGYFAFALFGSPYLLDSIPELPSYALAYEFYPGAESAMVRALFGEIPFQGKLPVTVSRFPVGFKLKK